MKNSLLAALALATCFSAQAQDIPTPTQPPVVLEKKIDCLPKELLGTGSPAHVSFAFKYVWYWCPAGPGLRSWHVFAAPDLSWATINSRLATIFKSLDMLAAARKGLIRNYADSPSIQATLQIAHEEMMADVAVGH
jgi:hypothetical protein